MSRIGKLPIKVPEKVEISYQDHTLSCKGPKGELTRRVHNEMKLEIAEEEIKVTRPSGKDISMPDCLAREKGETTTDAKIVKKSSGRIDSTGNENRPAAINNGAV